MSDLILTEEQKIIVATDIPRGHTLKIKAFAGCAKTTTLKEYARARLELTFLYLAFNRSVAEEGRETFPFNVTCKTGHSLAYRQFGLPYKNKLEGQIGYLKPFLLKDHMGVEKYAIGKFIIDVLIKYLSSRDTEITEEHLVLDREKTLEEYKIEKDAATRAYLLKKVNELWTRMQDRKDKKIPMLHDGYLKLFQLSKPQLHYDVVMLDEAHDTNGVMLDIFENQDSAKILCGDSHQAIYDFRWAHDALAKSKSNQNLYLSTSFRFGDEIASTANMLLQTVKGEQKPIKGFQPTDTIGYIDKTSPYTIVGRTNAALFTEAVRLLRNNNPQKFGFVGTQPRDNYSPFLPYAFDRILDIYYLYAGQKKHIKDMYIIRFRNFDEFISVIEDKDAPDRELKARAGVVKQYTHSIPDLIDRIVKNSYNPKEAHVTFTTAHRSKGLEWPQVILTEDYIELTKVDKDTGNLRIIDPDEVNEQEVNLLYVGATRAQKRLQPNKMLKDLKQVITDQ